MTREDIIKLFPDATDEQIGKLLGSHHKELNQFKDGAKKATELEAQLEEINNKSLTDIELAKKERDTALKSVETLQAQVKAMEMRTKFAEKGIVGDDADKLLKSITEGNFDFETLGNIITAREEKAAIAKEKEIANNAGNPGGVNNGGSDKSA